MALKEKALKRLAEKLNKSGIAWALYGDYMMVLRGIPCEWHGFELTVSEQDGAKADSLLTKLGMRHEEGPGQLAYHFDGADILLSIGLVPGFAAELAADTATVLGVTIPLLNRKEAADIAERAGKEKEAALLRA